MLPPDSTTPTRWPVDRDPARQQRGQGAGAARLDDQLQTFEAEPHRRHDLGVRHRHDLVDERLDHGPGQLTGRRRLLTVGDRRSHRHPLTTTARQRAGHVVGGERLDADHPTTGRQRLDDGRATRDQPAAPDRHDHRVELAGLREQLQRDRPLPRHHRRIVVGMHDGQPALPPPAPRAAAHDPGRSDRTRSPPPREPRSRPVSKPARRPASGSSRACRTAHEAIATAWAWLPELAVQTPRRSASGANDEIAL